MKKILLSLVVAMLVVFLLSGGTAQNTEWTLVGIVSCPVCVAKGATRVDLECARTCLTKDSSANLVIIEDNDYRMFPVDNPASVRSYVAHRVVVTGYRGQNGFHVVSVRTL